MGRSIRANGSGSKGVFEEEDEAKPVASSFHEENRGGCMNLRKLTRLYLQAIGDMRPINGYEYRRIE